MDIVGDRRFVEIPGDRLHDLPPLLIQSCADSQRMEKTLQMANALVESEEIIPPVLIDAPNLETQRECRKMDLAIRLVEEYSGLTMHWRMGDSILDWIRQCEMTFEMRSELRPFLRPDVWPHAGRCSFVTLLRDKAVDTCGIEPEKAVGMRLSFRQPPPLNCCSDQLLFYLKSTLASTAYQTWAHMSPQPVSSLPPERFRFEVHSL